MPSLKDLRNRIASVKATQKITKAMQMVAAAKLRRAQNAAENARPYAKTMQDILKNLTRNSQITNMPLMSGNQESKTHLILICTAERGLCGGFNANIARLARETIKKIQEENKSYKLFCVGKKGYDILKHQFKNDIIETVELRQVKNIQFSDAKIIADKILQLFDDDQFDRCTMLFSEFKSVISQKPTALQIIPVKQDAQAQEEEEQEQNNQSNAVYEYEPDENEILKDLLPQNITIQILRALLENAASEQGARMSAMDNATRNAGEMIEKLTLTYNRTRQAMITKELIEIISGAEAI